MIYVMRNIVWKIAPNVSENIPESMVITSAIYTGIINIKFVPESKGPIISANKVK